jgi:hypothetical protein
MSDQKAKKQKPKKWQKNAYDVIALWVNQSQESAKCRQAFFEGKSLYSYGYHYLMGLILTVKGRKVALINDSGYSRTTSSHCSHAHWQAKDAGLIALRVNDSTQLNAESIRQAMIRLQGEVLDDLMRHFQSNYFFVHEGQFKKSSAFDDVKLFNSYCKSLGMTDLKIEVSKDFLSLWELHVIESEAKWKRIDRTEQKEFDFAPQVRSFRKTRHKFPFLTIAPQAIP